MTELTIGKHYVTSSGALVRTIACRYAHVTLWSGAPDWQFVFDCRGEDGGLSHYLELGTRVHRSQSAKLGFFCPGIAGDDIVAELGVESAGESRAVVQVKVELSQRAMANAHEALARVALGLAP